MCIRDRGTEFALWKNRNGFIVYSDYANESSNYMMVLDTGDGSDKPGDRKEAKADILLADNSVKKDVKFATDLKIDGKNDGNTGYDKDSREWKESKVVGNVYKLSLIHIFHIDMLQYVICYFL